jgi:hypothetical protein
MFRRQVPEDLKDCRATEPGAPDFKLIIATVVRLDTTEARRSCTPPLRAANQLAVDSGTDPNVPLEFGTFGITVNPVASVSAAALMRSTTVRSSAICWRPNSPPFLKRVDALDVVPQREALKLCLNLGGQRPGTLLRTTVSDIDIDAGSITVHHREGSTHRPTPPHGATHQKASAILEAHLAVIRDIVERQAFDSWTEATSADELGISEADQNAERAAINQRVREALRQAPREGLYALGGCVLRVLSREPRSDRGRVRCSDRRGEIATGIPGFTMQEGRSSPAKIDPASLLVEYRKACMQIVGSVRRTRTGLTPRAPALISELTTGVTGRFLP